MEVEYSARQVKITKSLRTQAEEGIERIARILGKVTAVSISFHAQRHLHIADVTIQTRLHTIVSKGESASLDGALHDALKHSEHQVLRFRDKARTKKRLPKESKDSALLPVKRSRTRATSMTIESEDGLALLAGPKSNKTAKATAAKAKTAQSLEPHILRSTDAIAEHPMRIEEAVKEAESRDRDVLVFRDKKGTLFVLHHRRDGKIELTEIP